MTPPPPPHIIRLTITPDGKVKADPYPYPGKGGARVNPGDLLSWVYDPKIELQVTFSKVADLPLTDSPQLKDVSPYGPFSSLNVVIGGGQTFGTIRADVTDTNRRFFCEIYKDGKALEWIDSLPGLPQLGGGLDIPMTPG